ncbi:glycosyltransferase [Vibrio sp. Of7-15]|uniref:glycosyltransferase n=1 Tax=Vibrio sp. Of7-15 TaxID=2724879 RepID=UPI001EF2543A|nr:glycosyltransferase [Vibrio sp. Of7-15]MCG7496866.1 glycosyltransferase [Vibrio sp. Of7-15]
MKVCILLAAYNGEAHIKDQFDSILAQSDVDIDLYISLDRSTDKSLEIVQEYTNRYSNIHMLAYGQCFGSAGRNFFRLLLDVDFSKYDYVSFADQDDIWLENKIHSSIQLMLKNGADAYSGNVTAFWEDGKKLLIAKDSPQSEFDYLFESAGPGCTFVLTKSLALDIKKALSNKILELDSLWLHDWFCYSFARSNGYNWYIGSEPLMLYRQHESNEVGANTGFKAIVSRVKKVLRGDAFSKVLEQADFLEQNDLPIQMIKKGDSFSLLKLACMGARCRRKCNEKIYFSIALTLISIRRLTLWKA